MAYSKEVVKRFEEVTNNPAAHGVGRFDPKDPNVATGPVSYTHLTLPTNREV